MFVTGKYYDLKTVKIGKDGSVYYQGKVYQVNPIYSGYTGNIIENNRYVFIEINGNYSIITKRELPVYIRKRYSETKKNIEQTRPKKKQKNDYFSNLN